VIEQSRYRKGISALECLPRRLRLSRQEAVDRARVKPQFPQVGFCHLDVTWRQDPIEGGPVRPGRGRLCLWGDAGGEEPQRQPRDQLLTRFMAP
jgi:hypothetical protein